ncbi:efflux transporter outer membrane subunit [Luteimonas sp. RC10]|uniref:efflux transporter outer membrane subunit n=1 Tax=Luteimonas sp. RC10 TaxID=2587035 RepID=UPI00181825FC|nr:efflux transporter outer membrane subunit [Luteimonas sp. RC10]MBB3344575.1 NodT family efflux transporter outer membrane factor (OMF) lipoprotein [Luteimonas sp. RC10]
MAALLAGLSGCATVGPDYRAPTVAVPADWTAPGATVRDDDRDAPGPWWRTFQDPLLERLVTQALAHNQDLDIALARLRQARAERAQIASASRPEVSIGGAAEAAHHGGRSDEAWQLGIDASWTLDLFGGTRRAVEAADAGIQALAEDRDALQAGLVAELVADYAGLRATQHRLSIARDEVATLIDIERLAEQAHRSGLGTLADVALARAERATAQARLPVLEADIARLSHALGVLTGGFPGDWQAALHGPAPMLPSPAHWPRSLPSEVIGQRPDLRADERRLAAATAQIGVAQAQGLPAFRIPLGIGTTADTIRALFSAATRMWSVGLQGRQVLYDARRTRAATAAAQANAEAVRRIYERDIRVALREVEDALTAWTSERRRQASLQAAVVDSEQALDDAMRLYAQGLRAYQPVLVAQRTVHQTRDDQVLGQLAELRALVALQTALGAQVAVAETPATGTGTAEGSASTR